MIYYWILPDLNKVPVYANLNMATGILAVRKISDETLIKQWANIKGPNNATLFDWAHINSLKPVVAASTIAEAHRLAPSPLDPYTLSMANWLLSLPTSKPVAPNTPWLSGTNPSVLAIN